MKYSSTAIKELNARYGKILRKCALLNAAILIATAIATPATATTVITQAVKVAAGEEKTLDDYEMKNQNDRVLYNQGNTTVSNSNFYGNDAGTKTGILLNYDGELTVENTTLEQNKSAIGAIGNWGKLTVKDTEFINNIGTSETSATAGAISSFKGTVSIDGSTFTENTVTLPDGVSGAIYITGEDATDGSSIKNSTFMSNTAQLTNADEDSYGTGGAVGFASDSLTIEDSTFNSNKADVGGAVISYEMIHGGHESYEKRQLSVSDSTFSSNEATMDGGALALGDVDTQISGSEFTSNEAANYGGAIYNTGAGTTALASDLTLSNNTFTTNEARYGGAIYNAGTMNISGDQFIGNNASYVGGAMFLAADSDTTISNALFKENKSTTGWGGAIYTSYNMKNLVISDSEFLNNEARGTGALGIYNKATLTNVSFSNNKATDATDEGGGAISLGAESVVQLTNGTFTGNTSAQDGGAITMRAADSANNSAAKLDIENSSFSGNIAATRGGAIYSTFYNSQKAVSSVYIANTTFTSNNAKEGGAIYNDGIADAQNNLSAIKLENATFTDNIATTKGGALFNAANGTVTLSGTNTFSGNTAGGVKNDIHNDGTLNISGLLTLDGGITGTGTVKFLEGSSLKAALNASSAIINAGTITGETAFVLENGSEGGTITLSGVQTDFKFLDNALYTITDDDNGTYTFAKKSSEEIVASTGATGSEAAAVSGVTSGTSSNEEFNAVANDINTMLQSSDAAVVAQGVKAAATLAPSDAPVVQSQATQTVSQILAAASSRLSSGISTSTGESSGDMIMGDGAVWVKGLYNKSKLSGKNGFDSHSKGLALGAEAQLTDAVKVGLGYAYTNSEIKPELRKNEVDSNSALLYAEYKPNNWFLNGIASYTWGSYDEHKYVAGSDISADYDVNSIALQAMTGYDIKANAFTFTPEAGLRYMNIHQKSYTDSVDNHVKENKSDILTGVFGLKTVMDWEVSKSVVLKPELRAAVTYDFVHDDATSVMTMANGSVVSVEGKALKRFGTEFGAGFLTDIGDNIELGIFWEGKFRKDYTDNTGMINLKYAF